VRTGQGRLDRVGGSVAAIAFSGRCVPSGTSDGRAPAPYEGSDGQGTVRAAAGDSSAAPAPRHMAMTRSGVVGPPPIGATTIGHLLSSSRRGTVTPREGA
jgi:hypothetical protein